MESMLATTDPVMTAVVIYTREFCGFCTRAKQLLDRKGVGYDERNATYSPELRAEMLARSNGRATFPQVFVGTTHVGGCDDLYALDRAGKLDALLRDAGDGSTS